MTIWEVFQYLLTVVEVFMCYWVCDFLQEDGRLISKTKFGLICCLSSLIAIGTAWNRNVVFFSYPVYLQQLCLIWLSSCLIFRKRKVMCFLLVFNYHLIVMLLDYIGVYFLVSLSSVSFWNDIYYHTSGWKIIIFFTSRFIMTFLCIFLVKIRKKYSFNIDLYKNVLVVSIVIGCIWGWWFQKSVLVIKDDNSLGNVIFIFSCFLVLIAILVVEINSKNIKYQSQFVQMKNEALEENYRNLRNLYENNQYIYHDFKNHMTLLKQYLDQREYNRALDYVNRIIGPMEQLDSLVSCNREVVNLVVNLKGYEANQKDIRVITDIDNFEDNIVEDMDLGNILLNLLDNAIEACEQIKDKEKWIGLTIKKRHEMLIIRVENNIEKRVNKKDGEYISNKSNLAIHGLGIKSVKAIINKYEAEAEWSNTKDKFTVIITFFKNV